MTAISFRTDLAHFFRRQWNEVAPLPQHLSGDDATWWHRHQLEHRHRGYRLAAARFADHTHRLAALDRQVHAVDRVQPAVIGLEVVLSP